MNDALLEPGVAYQREYKDAFHANCEKLFNSLVKQSGLNEDKNRETAAAYRAKDAESKNSTSTLSKKKGMRVLLILLAVLGGIVALVGVFTVAGNTTGLWLIIGGVIVLAGSIILIVRVVNPKIRNLASITEQLKKEAADLYATAMQQMKPLLALFDSVMTSQLIHETVPTLIIDKTFDMRRYDYLHGKYGLTECDDDETSVVHLISGEILGNPFIVEQDRVHKMGKETYTGSLTIHWTEYGRDAQGHTVTHHRSETLHASVDAPKPNYTLNTRLIYGNDAAPDLSFTRTPTHAERLSEKDLERKIKKGAKDLHKKAEKNVGSGFTEVGNETFDVLFGALDRDHEVQFRLLFTPLAQKNMVSILTGKTSPFGDDFCFDKSKCLNYIRSEHGQTWDFDINVGMYDSYDIDICRKKFFDENEDDFKQLYFDLAPLLSIPLYQQQKPLEYIYGTSYPRNCTAREAEVIANAFPSSLFMPNDCATPCILKTSLLSKHEKSDDVKVTAYGYRTEARVTYVSVHGGDGRYHDVPVHWTEYIPVEKEDSFTMEPAEMTDPEFKANPRPDSVFLHRILATYLKK